MPRTVNVNDQPLPGYRLTKYLGRGGVGEVWQAEAPGQVAKAIKLIPLEDTEALLTSRELQGLEKIRGIRHPYLLAIDRYEIVNGHIVVVMELADKSLADRFDECYQRSGCGIPRDELVRYLREAAEVLDVLSHEHGLQHLDIKPENLFLSAGHVKVADFGLVQPERTTVATSALAFTPAYAPPELFHGRVEATADQYSLAVTYQELLTGRRPYSATSFRELIYQHAHQEPDLAMLPPGDQGVVRYALSKLLERRFISCMAFVAALETSGRTDALGGGNTVAARPGFTPTVVTNDSAKPTPSKGGSKFVVRAPGARGSSPTVSETGQPARANTGSVALESGGPPSGVGLPADRPTCVAAERDKVRATFLACLPVELYARKLRAFMDALGADMVECAGSEETTLRFRPQANWLGIRSTKMSLLMRIETYSHPDRNDSHVVHATVWPGEGNMAPPDLARRGMLLIRCIKAYLMASEKMANQSFDPAALRAAIWRDAKSDAKVN